MEIEKRALILKTVRQLIATEGIEALTHPRLAGLARIPLQDLYCLYPKCNMILHDLIADIARHHEDLDKSDDLSPYDALLDYLMQRFEVMQRQRESLLPVLKELQRSPKDWPRALKDMALHLKTTLQTVGFSTPPATMLKIMSAYLNTLRVWQTDENQDLNATFSTLDRGMRWALKDSLHCDDIAQSS